MDINGLQTEVTGAVDKRLAELLSEEDVLGARLNEAHVRGGPPLLPDETGETDESVLDKYRLAFPPQ